MNPAPDHSDVNPCLFPATDSLIVIQIKCHSHRTFNKRRNPVTLARMDPMTQDTVRIILTSTVSEKDAQALAAAMIEAPLAACVQISAAGTSIYRWEDSVQHEHEHFISIKTTATACEAAVDWLNKHHPYETPEIIILQGSASSNYLEWMRATTC